MKESKTCKFCGKDYDGRGKDYCSKSCATRKRNEDYWQENSAEKSICPTCGVLCNRTGVRFCSRICYAKSMKGNTPHNKGKKQSEETIRKRIENTDQYTKESKRKTTLLKNYGVEYVSQIPEVKEKLSLVHKGSKRPRQEGQQDKIIEAKRLNGTIKHSEDTKKKISESLKETFSDPGFDKSVFVKEDYNKNSKTGYYKGLYFRSSYEEMFLKFCDFYKIEVKSAGNNNFSIGYIAEDSRHHVYFPDFYLPDCGTIVEIKANKMLDFERTPFKIQEALLTVENYRVLTEIDGFISEREWEDFYETDVKYWFRNDKKA